MMNAPAQLKINPIVPITIFVVVISLLFLNPFALIKAGHVGVVSLFGKVNNTELPEGFNLKNPLAKVTQIDCRIKKLELNNVGVPTQDQLSTTIDYTINWRINKSLAAEAYQQTGNANELADILLTPKVRSLLREAGKGVLKAEDFFKDEIQNSMQDQIRASLDELIANGIIIESSLIRNITLPKQVAEGVTNKKRQEQLAEQQKAEYDRFKTEQQQKIAQAEAEKNAAIQEAEKRIALADAKAYEITAEAKARAEAIKIEGEALRNNSEVIKLRSVEKWNGSVPNVMLGDGAIPMINLGDIAK